MVHLDDNKNNIREKGPLGGENEERGKRTAASNGHKESHCLPALPPLPLGPLDLTLPSHSPLAAMAAQVGVRTRPGSAQRACSGFLCSVRVLSK